MGGPPEIAVGTAVDDDGELIVRLSATIDGEQQFVADMLPCVARDMASALIDAADRVEQIMPVDMLEKIRRALMTDPVTRAPAGPGLLRQIAIGFILAPSAVITIFGLANALGGGQ